MIGLLKIVFIKKFYPSCIYIVPFSAEVMHDRPAAIFKPISLDEKHEVMLLMII